MTDWKKVQGSQEEKPAAFDKKTSAFVVYQRRNVKRITWTSPDGVSTELWEYEERELTPEEYAIARVEEQDKTVRDMSASVDFFTAQAETQGKTIQGLRGDIDFLMAAIDNGGTKHAAQ